MPAELATSGLLPSPPGVVMEILRLIADENTNAEDLAHVIDADPVLAARLLGTVNSGLYTLVREIHSITDAAVLVGFRTIRTLAMSVSMADGIPAEPASERFDLELYWRHSLMTSVLAKRLALEVKKTLAEDAFSVGLIANVGRLVVARCAAERYDEVLAYAAWPNSATEQAILGYCTAEVSAALLRMWQLPPSLCAAVRFVDNPTQMPDKWDDNTRTTSRVVFTADRTVSHLLRAENNDEIHEVAGRIAGTLNIPHSVATEVLDDAGDQIGQVQHLISNNLPEQISPADLIQGAQRLLEEAGV